MQGPAPTAVQGSAGSAAQGLAGLWAETWCQSSRQGGSPVPLRSQFGFLLQAQCLGLFRVPFCKAAGLATEGTRWREVFGFLPSSEKTYPSPHRALHLAHPGVRATALGLAPA